MPSGVRACRLTSRLRTRCLAPSSAGLLCKRISGWESTISNDSFLTSGYQQLDERLALTLVKKESLLMVLSHPEILLHNNSVALGARQRVSKLCVSMHARASECT